MTVAPGKYRHFKGGEYEVLGVARDTETLEELVVYKALYASEQFPKGQLWARPRAMFTDTVKHNGERVPRFEKV